MNYMQRHELGYELSFLTPWQRRMILYEIRWMVFKNQLASIGGSLMNWWIAPEYSQPRNLLAGRKIDTGSPVAARVK